MRRTVLALAIALTAARGAHTLALAEDPPSGEPDRPGLFVSGELVAGGVVKAQLAAGWGQPHVVWAGAEVFALTTTEFGAMYGGLRGHLRFLDATLGVRETAAYQHGLLPVQARYDSTDAPGPAARYASIDASAVAYGPVPRGYVMAWVDLVVPLGIPKAQRLFEEYERVVVGPGATIAARLAYLAAFADDTVLVGPMGEGVRMGGRDASCWRIGGAVFWTIRPRWSLYTVLTTPVAGRDDLGAWEGLWGTVGVRYQWAKLLGR